MGKSEWIAGVQYLHSLLYGNSLLPASEQALLSVFLGFGEQLASDYRAVRDRAQSIHITDFSGAPSLVRRLRRITITLIRRRRWPGWPTHRLPDSVRQTGIEVLFSGVHFQEECKLPQICWIPDFQHHHRPEFFSDAERKVRDEQFGRIMAKAARVIVSNQCSYADALRRYPEAQAKLAVIPFTMDLGNGWRTGHPARVIKKYGLPSKFLLFPSQFWKHKNHELLFRAIQLLRERGMHDIVLVCTGVPHDYRFPQHATELRGYLADHRLERSVRILGLLPRADQVQLMRAAAAIVQPSLFEGWSALVEECRSLGKTILASDIPQHREQQHDRMQLFDPGSVESLADLLIVAWPTIHPGPDIDREAAAETEHRSRIRDFAGQFVSLCRGVMRENVPEPPISIIPL